MIAHVFQPSIPFFENGIRSAKPTGPADVVLHVIPARVNESIPRKSVAWTRLFMNCGVMLFDLVFSATNDLMANIGVSDTDYFTHMNISNMLGIGT